MGIDKLKSIAERSERECAGFMGIDGLFVQHYLELRAALRVAIAQLEIYEGAIDFSMADDMWVSNGEYDEWFKYKYTTWYQDVLLSAKQDAEKLGENL